MTYKHTNIAINTSLLHCIIVKSSHACKLSIKSVYLTIQHLGNIIAMSTMVTIV